MTTADATIEAIATDRLTSADRAAITALCSAAYEEDFAPYLALIGDGLHLVRRAAGGIVAHATIVERWLQPEGAPLLRTAYVEAVATLPAAQHRGHASALLAALPDHMAGFDIAALSPSDPGFYARFGWECWQGPLLARRDAMVEAVADEVAMILRLARTPPLDLAAPLSIEWRPGEIW